MDSEQKPWLEKGIQEAIKNGIAKEKRSVSRDDVRKSLNKRDGRGTTRGSGKGR